MPGLGRSYPGRVSARRRQKFTENPSMQMDEEILVVRRLRLLDEPLHGFTREGLERHVNRVRVHGVFRPRHSMERDPSWKQIIPYLIVRHASWLFLFQRSAAGGEARLHGKYSIGLGGHINRGDVEGADDIVAASLQRELEEELVIHGSWRARLVGVLNDDTNPVGQVHFGLVHVVEVDGPAVRVRGSEALSGRLADQKEVLSLRDQMETWSQLILDAVDPLTL